MSGGELLLILVAVTAGGLVKAVTGMGLPLIAVPFMAAVMGVEDAVVVIALPNVAANVYLSWRNRAAWPDTPPMGVLFGTGAVGAVVGTLLLSRLDDRILSGVLAVVVLGYVLTKIRGRGLALSGDSARRAAPVAGAAAGITQGAAGISGPVVVTYVHSLGLARAAHVLSVTTWFLALGLAQLVTLVALGEFTDDRLVGAALAAVPIAAATLVGSSLGEKLPARAFDRVVLIVLGASAIALLVRVL